MFRRILVPTDFSPSAGAALDLARRHFPRATRCLLHVLDPKLIASTLASPVGAKESRESLARQATERLAELKIAGEEYGVAVGSAVDVILTKAEEWQSDLIVMGTHGRTGLAHFLNGSVAERVVRLARRPVLIEHERKA